MNQELDLVNNMNEVYKRDDSYAPYQAYFGNVLSREGESPLHWLIHLVGLLAGHPRSMFAQAYGMPPKEVFTNAAVIWLALGNPVVGGEVSLPGSREPAEWFQWELDNPKDSDSLIEHLYVKLNNSITRNISISSLAVAIKCHYSLT